MLTIKVPLKDAEKTKRALLSKGRLDTDFNPVKESGFIFFPVKSKFKTSFSFVEKDLIKRQERFVFKSKMEEVLSKDELEMLKTSMDVIGRIAILEIPRELEPREKLIAETLLKANKNLSTVLKKGKHEGTFRTQSLKWLAGDKTKEATYRENGIILKLDVEKVYFSPRLSYERKRIMKLVKKGEEILVMFSGCAPYVCVLAKNTPAKRVDGVEINPVGHDYALENIRLNKLKNAEVFCGDVKDVVPELGRSYDRILMPLPKTADEYLEVAIKAAKKKAIIHFYDFEKETEQDNGVEKIKKACAKTSRTFKIKDVVKAGQHGPRAYRFCFDFKLD
jgi:tRNA (guanine37-N1)-methyltransferase